MRRITVLAAILVLAAGCSRDFSLPSASGVIVGGLTVDPTPAATGATLKIDFTVAGSSDVPVVHLLGSKLPAPSGPDANGQWQFTYAVKGTEPEGIDVPVQVNVGSGSHAASALGDAVFDFTPPSLLSAKGSPTDVGPGDTLDIDLVTSEPLSAPPALTLGGNTVTCAPTDGKQDVAVRFRCAYAVTAADAAGWVTVDADLVDRAGNEAKLTAVPVGAAIDLGGAPTFTAFTARPSPASKDMNVELAITSSLPLSAPPAVTIAGQAAIPEGGPDGLGVYTLRYHVTGVELGTVDPSAGDAPVHVAGTSTSGNDGSADFTLPLDFKAPDIVSVTPSKTVVTEGDTLDLAIVTDEPAAALSTTVQGLSMSCSPDAAAPTTDWTCTYVATGTEQDGPQSIVVHAADPLGNDAFRSVDGGFVFDFVCRWDATKTRVVKRYGRAPVFEADPAAFEPGATIDLTDGPGGLAVDTGIVAAADGSVADVSLPAGTANTVWVSATDTVGHSCPGGASTGRFLVDLGGGSANPSRAVAGPVGDPETDPLVLEARGTDVKPALASVDGSAASIDGPTGGGFVKVANGSQSYPDLLDNCPMVYDPATATTEDWQGYGGSGAMYSLDVEGTSGSWSSFGWSPFPSAVSTYGVAYDRARRQMLLFGGFNLGASALDSTWAFGPSGWTFLSPADSPPGRNMAAMVYDEAHDVTVLAGGTDGINALADTWTFDGIDWHELTSATSLGARSGQAIAYDRRRQRVVVFGGTDFTNLLGDTRELVGTDWVPVTTAHHPSPRTGARMVYDPGRRAVVLFGGEDTSGGPLHDVWTYDGADWTKLSPTSTTSDPLPAVSNPAMTYDPWAAGVVIFGGDLTPSAPSMGLSSDTWLLPDPGTVPLVVTDLEAPVDTWGMPNMATLAVTARAGDPGGAWSGFMVSLWDVHRAGWSQVAASPAGLSDGLTTVTATIRGPDLPRYLSGDLLRVQVRAARASDASAGSRLQVDAVSLALDE